MKKTILVAFATLLFAVPALAGEGWFDLANCGVCKSLGAQEGLVESLTWEHYITKDGAMTVTVVPADKAEAYAAATAGMEAAGMKMAQGEEMDLCGFCTSFGAILATGKANMENFDTPAGSVMLVTSHDAEVAAKIHKHTKRTIKEIEKMMEGEAHDDHAGHSHGE